MLFNILLQESVLGRVCRLDHNETSVKGACHLLSECVRWSFAPIKFDLEQSHSFKVSLFSWRLIQNQLSTKTNFIQRGIINAESSSSLHGCGV